MAQEQQNDSMVWDSNSHPRKPDLATTLQALRAGSANKTPAADVFYGLSDLTTSAIPQVREVWNTLDPLHRRRVLVDLTETSESNVELDYRALGMLALEDPHAEVRRAAIELLWEDESLELMAVLSRMAREDISVEVRAAAVGALGRFVLAGELGELPEEETTQAWQIAYGLYQDTGQDVEVRRRALEAIANATDKRVSAAIRQAYSSDERPLQVSAIFAMGRTCDEMWEDIILEELNSEDGEKQFEAARAAGEIVLHTAVRGLSRLAVGDDRELQEMAIWSLGEIGGKEAERVLNALMEYAEENEDEALIDLIDEALGGISLASGDLFGLNFSNDD